MKNLFKTLLVNFLCISTAYSAPVDIAPFKTTSAQINQITNKAGTGPVEFPAGITGGASEINLVKNSNNAANWTASGAGITVATTTTASDLPLNATTAIKITPVSGTDYAKYCVSLPTALKNKKLKFEWWQHYLSGYASGDLKLEIYKNSSTNCGGSNTKISLSTDDTSAITSIPALDGKFSSYFDTETNDSYEIRFVRVSGTTAIVISNVVFGPGIQPQGSVVEEWVSFSPSLVNVVLGTGGTSWGYYRRIGESMQIRVGVNLGTGIADITGTVRLNIPDSKNINATKIDASTTQTFGSWTGLQDSTGVRYAGVTVLFTSPTQVSFRRDGESVDVNNTSPFNWSDNDRFSCEFTVPIAEWAGSGTLNVAQNDVEYSSNSSSGVTTDSTSFVYGPSGSPLPSGSAAATFLKRVRFQTPIQQTDIILVEVQASSTAPWVEMQSEDQATGLGSMQLQNANEYGIGVKFTRINDTDIDIAFGRYAIASGATYGAAGTDWNAGALSGYRWRVKKSKGGQAVGFGKATPQSAGIVTSYSPTVRSRYLAVSSTNYTILDSDGYDTILVTTGASTRTITLPAIANNAGRILTIKKADSGAGTVLIDTPGSELIDGAAQNELFEQFAFVKIIADGTNWSVLSAYDLIRGSSINQTITNILDTAIIANSGTTITGSSVSIKGGVWVCDAMVVYNNGTGQNATVFKAGIVNATGETLNDSTPTGRVAFVPIDTTIFDDRVSTSVHRTFSIESPITVEVRAVAAQPTGGGNPQGNSNHSAIWTYKRIR